MIKNICLDIHMKQFLMNKISNMLHRNISKKFDYIVKNTTDLEFYAYYHNLFVKTPFYKHFNENKEKYQHQLYERKYEMVSGMVHVRGKYILDVGQEDCYYKKLFEERGGAKMEGINIGLTMNYTGDKSCITIYDGVNIPFENGIFDLVLIHMVLHHVLDEWDALLKDVYRVLGDGGILIIEDHDFKGKRGNELIDIFHCLYEMVESVDFNIEYYNNYKIRRFLKEDLVNTLKEIGFVDFKFTISKGNPLNKYYLICKKN